MAEQWAAGTGDVIPGTQTGVEPDQTNKVLSLKESTFFYWFSLRKNNNPYQ